MHDVGKIGIPDRILLKPGRLTEDERKVMEAHTEMGHRILAGSEVELLDLAAEMALTHHERIDGTRLPGRDSPATRSRSRGGSARSPTSSTRSPPIASTGRPSSPTRPAS